MIFLLLATSGMGLWWHWEPWVRERRCKLGHHYSQAISISVSGDGRHVELTQRSMASSAPDAGKLRPEENLLYTRVLEVASGKELRVTSEPDTGQSIHLWIGLRRSVRRGKTRELWFPGGTFFEPGPRGPARAGPVRLIVDGRALARIATPEPVTMFGFSPDGERVALLTRDNVYIYRRRRPEWWWGVFWLWEFWLTAAFAALLIWSIIRDRRALRARR